MIEFRSISRRIYSINKSLRSFCYKKKAYFCGKKSKISLIVWAHGQSWKKFFTGGQNPEDQMG